ncbi:Exosome complex component rrp42 [Tritrichomonas musculus]|uniref:Ribosomal RNA-processing protein 42 n=1 Tax=Tritrichomonas musculus TaxID=1915356 RepID=A0ABR2ICJ5_9EUKA
MQSLLLSKGEKDFIQGLLNQNIRVDGRNSDEMRDFSIEMNPLPLSPSSCRVIWGHGYGDTTEILVSVSTEVMKTEESQSQLSVKSLANSFGENADGTEICQVVYSTLYHFLQNSGVLDPSHFEIVNSPYSWKLFIDVLIIKAAGAVYEAAMIGIRESLRELKFPQLIITPGETISELHFDIDESKPPLPLIDESKLPFAFSFAPVGDSLLRDPTPLEVAVVQSLLVIGVGNDNTILGLNHFGECGMKSSILSYIQENISKYLEPFIGK